jgi:protein SCO1/2
MRGLLVLLVAAAAIGARAQSELPEPLRGVGIDQRLNEPVPLEAVFRNESGQPVRLGDYLGRRPAILALVYYECPMLCTLVLNGLLRTLRALPAGLDGRFEILTVSFDPREGPALAAAKKEEYIRRYERAGAAERWHFLTGDEHAIAALTQAVGFRYKFDAKTNQFAHASAIVVLTPGGKVARYLYGIEYAPRDLRLALVEASAGKIGSRVDQALLYCFHYDPAAGKYSLIVMRLVRVLGTATLAALAAFLFVNFRRDRRGKEQDGHDGFSAVP